MARPKNKPYQKITDIPPHIFRNKLLTHPVGDELKEYLRYMLDNHPDDLHYLYRKSQRYIKHGGASVINFERWRLQLDKQLQKEGF